MRSSMRSPDGTSFSRDPGERQAEEARVFGVPIHGNPRGAEVSVIPQPVPNGKRSPSSCTARRCMRSHNGCGSNAPP